MKKCVGAMDRWAIRRQMVVSALLLAALLLAALWLGGCGSGDPCADVVCGVGQICFDGQCLSASDESCEPGCGAGEVCQGGRCISEGGGCDYQGQACAPGEHLQWDGLSLCVDWQGGTGANGVCSADCANQACPSGSTCFALNLGASQSCSGAADCGDRELCYEGQCVVAVCRPSECEISRGVDADCPSGQRCDRLAPGFAMCVPGGSRQVGEECIDAEVANASGRFVEGCVADAICLGGICQAFCEDGGCGGAKECIDADLGDGQKAPVCAATCVPGAEEESACADDETCVPSGAGQGICRPAGELEAFAPCGDGMGLCEPGTICAEQEGGDPLSRCLPVCDLGAAEVGSDGVLDGEGQEARDGTCPQPEVGQGLWLAWHLGPSLAAVDLYVDDAFRTTVDPANPAQLSDDGNYGLRPEGRVE